jgi:dienelactone hydrolase
MPSKFIDYGQSLPMYFPTFTDLQAHIQELYQERQYEAALELATEQTPHFPDQFPLLFYWRICMAARIGQYGLALHILDEMLDNGFWYSETLLRKSPSLLPMQELIEFEARLTRNRLLQNEEQAQLFPLLTLRSAGRCSFGQEPCPLLICLHANGSTAQDSVDFWRAAASAGWLVAIPQSTQAMWKGAYLWDDREISERELVKHHQALVEKYAVDPKRVALAGHLMGGELAIWLAIKGIIPAEGFIAIGPGGPLMEDVENWTAMLREIPNRKLRGYLIMGQEDHSVPQENIRILADILNEAGIPTDLEEIPGLSRDYSIEYEDSLLRGLNFIEEVEDV